VREAQGVGKEAILHQTQLRAQTPKKKKKASEADSRKLHELLLEIEHFYWALP
jgi:hypothetical protein